MQDCYCAQRYDIYCIEQSICNGGYCIAQLYTTVRQSAKRFLLPNYDCTELSVPRHIITHRLLP